MQFIHFLISFTMHFKLGESPNLYKLSYHFHSFNSNQLPHVEKGESFYVYVEMNQLKKQNINLTNISIIEGNKILKTTVRVTL